jgi:hypothetical protein
VLIKSVAQSTLTYILHEHFSLTNYIRWIDSKDDKFVLVGSKSRSN